jgi:hypothetical protein
MRPFFTRRNAPIWLPALIFVRDFLAWQYIFSFEPGITAEAVYRGRMMMLPGGLVPGGFTVIAVNLVIAFCIGLVLHWSARPRLENGTKIKLDAGD